MVLTWRNWYPWLTAWNAASPIACEDGRKTVKLESNRYIPLEVVHQRRLKHLYATRLTFTDHWNFDLSVSDLGSVAWMEKECSQQRYKSRGNTTDQLYERIEWQTFFSCITCSCRHDALSVGDQSSNPIFVWELWNIQCSDLLSKRPDKITQVVMLFPDWFRFPSCYRSNSTVFGPPTWSLNLNVVMAVKCRGRRLQCWSIDAPEWRLPWDIFNYFNPGHVERSWRWFTV